MSGANCGSGCTDCPTCRGEVQPDSPVMQDMEFAMAMARGPMGQDKFLGPLSVVQTVREGARRRGGTGPGDRAILSFLGQSVRVVPKQLAPNVLSVEEDDESDGVGHPLSNAVCGDDGGGGAQPAKPVTPTVPRKRTAQELEWEKTKVDSPDAPPTEDTSEKECGVRTFEYPECWYPMWNTSDATMELVIGLFFKAHAVYIPTGEGEDAKYDCACCEFRQYVELDVDLPWLGAKGKTPKPVEDCVVTVDAVKDGETTRVARALPLLRAATPQGTWQEFLDALGNPAFRCTGRRANPDPEDEEYVGDAKTSCDYTYRDRPQVTIPIADVKTSGWRFGATYIGRVVDICHKDAIRAEGRFTFSMDYASARLAVADKSKKTPGFKGGPPADKRKTEEDCK